MIDTSTRDAELRHILITRRREIQTDVQRRIRDGRTDRPYDGPDDLERTDVSSQGDIDLALLQMRAETLVRIDQALRRLDAGDYGSCSDCDKEITERRLRALPFAARCQSCEERREQAQGQAQQRELQRGRQSLFA